jgi:hypothetical protein
MLQALDNFLERSVQHYRFVTVPELLRLNTNSRKATLTQQFKASV